MGGELDGTCPPQGEPSFFLTSMPVQRSRITAGHAKRAHSAVGTRGGSAHEGAEPQRADV